MEPVLSYLTLMNFIKSQWELNNRHPSLEVHRDAFVSTFGNISFSLINEFLHDLDERYGAIRVTEYAYSAKWEEGRYLDLSAEEIAVARGEEPEGKNIDAINKTILTTLLVVEPNFLNVLESMANPWQKITEPNPVESLSLAKLKLTGRTLSIEFESKQAEIWTFDSKKRKGYVAAKSLLEAKSEMRPKDGITTGRLGTNPTQLPRLFHLEKELAKIFYRHNKTHVALNHRVELNQHDALIVRNYVNRKMRQNRES